MRLKNSLNLPGLLQDLVSLRDIEVEINDLGTAVELGKGIAKVISHEGVLARLIPVNRRHDPAHLVALV